MTRALYTDCRSLEDDDGRCLYRRLLGDAWTRLPISLRCLHAAPCLHARGKATVARGSGVLARAVAALFHFPAAATQVDASVFIHQTGGSEVWIRDFGGRRFSSVQYAGHGRSRWRLCERFGPIVFEMALVAGNHGLRYVVRRWTIFGLPLPRRLAPSADAREFEEAGKFRFHVEIRSPLTGLIVRYSGYLEPVAEAAPGARRSTAAAPTTA